MKVQISECDSKVAILNYSPKKVVIKINRHWHEELKAEITKRLQVAADEMLARSLGCSMKGTLDPDKPHYIEMRSNNKSSPKVIGLNVTELLAVA